ncbi:uncharacterized protein HMPREF1541_10258 [Cyphellophora europaea CBS 101466]|uniref:AAA+ ATPase domain-containing protein n=1 Tax=Cyphellophora europaea (strain CBS 101466) TaxID=1220924 RepID=W2S981_CYPE1|nr:uncharacterized protein HMPREF1541_10258 [Cyphellophora europaea CBS 101466]ETN44588.1 hypothetical protein HMPREF1541_10258 [Cyphellophora europaea CBS 101466]
MDHVSQAAAKTASKGEKSLSDQFFGQIGLPAFIITTFYPQLISKLAKYPKTVRLLSLPLALWIGWEFVAAKLTTFWYKLMSNGMSSVLISSEDGALHSSFRRFLNTKKLMMLERQVTATSTQYLRNQVSNGRLLERNLGDGKSVVFDPKNKFQFFWHEGRMFVLTVERLNAHLNRSDITVWTFGWSPEPIRRMLVDAYELTLKQDGQVLTQIFVPYSGRQWTQRCSKPRRPLESVYLAEGQKQMLLKDVGEYLDDATVRWYEDRGIPHRRGYLFHGRPGTGKTTLALALAGQFKLQVYMLSLLDNDVSDNSLLVLFQSIRKGTLILLEDVDCAGIERRPKARSKIRTKIRPTDDGTEESASGSRVTLSGLLNAIDGAGAPEGHILIMTTNKPDVLDEALVRAGRVDVHVEFGNATRFQIRDIFINMYHPATAKGTNTTFYVKKDAESESSKQGNKEIDLAQADIKKKKLEIHALAETFAESVPHGRFSPAELQDYILLYKNQPQAAVDNVHRWVWEKLGQTPASDASAIPDDSESCGDDNIFSENHSQRSTLASSVSSESLPQESPNKATSKTKILQGDDAAKTLVKDNAGRAALMLANKLCKLKPEQLTEILGNIECTSNDPRMPLTKGMEVESPAQEPRKQSR